MKPRTKCREVPFVTLESIASGLRSELLAGRNVPPFEIARTRHPVLRDHADIVSALSVLADTAGLRRAVRDGLVAANLEATRGADYADKQRIVVALLSEQCREPHALWTAALVWAFLPALRRIRNSIQGDALRPEDADLAVIEAFIETAAEFDPDRPSPRACAWLVQRTRDRLFNEIRAEQRRRALVKALGHDEDLEGLLNPDIDWIFGNRWKKPRGEDAAELAALLRRLVGRAIPCDRLDAVIATRLQGRRLRDYVNDLHGGIDTRHRERRYQRAKREHSRTLAEVRRLLERFLVPDEDSDRLD